MALKPMVLQFGMGTDIRGRDSTKAAERALKDALAHNGLGLSRALGLPTTALEVEVRVGVPRPETVDKNALLALLPHVKGSVEVVEGGLEIVNEAGSDATLIANAAAIVRLDV